MKTRNGKIARLPKTIRQELNHRLDNGAQAPELLPWLNALPEVQSVLAEFFNNQPISKHNISDWRRGGYQDWLRHQERRQWVQRSAEEGDELAVDQGKFDGYESLARILMADLAAEVHALHDITDKETRWKRFRELCRDLVRLQAEYHRGQKADLVKDKFEWQLKKEGARYETKITAPQAAPPAPPANPPIETSRSESKQKERKPLIASYRECGCPCDTCNASSGLTAQEIANAGKSDQPDGKFVNKCRCRCFCERCAQNSTGTTPPAGTAGSQTQAPHFPPPPRKMG